MKKSIIIILAVVAILVIWAVSVYNGLVTMDENVSGQWANVETQYQRRADLIPNLVNTVKGYATHEKETLEGVVAARSQATQIKVDAADLTPEKLAQYQKAQGAVTSALGNVFLDGVAAGAIGGVVYLMEQVRRVHQQNKIIYTVVACFLAGLLAQACVGIGFGVNLDLIMIGDIMLFIPGLVIVNGVREFFYADILTGLYRLVEALLIAGAIAAGYAVSLMMGGSL